MGAGKSHRVRAVLLAGICAGVVSTLAQLLLWLLSGQDALLLLLRDSRLTAALLLGNAVLPPPATFDFGVMLAATAIHFMLSMLYAAMLLPWKGRSMAPSLIIGSGFGVALYFLNLYGFTALFPWFAEARGGITLTVHAIFGIVVMLTYRYCGIRR
jgi:hypothetical protein